MDKVKQGLLWFFKSFIWLFILMLVIDIVTKAIVRSNMELGQSIVLIPGFLAITFSYNEKAAFGMGFADANLNRWVYVVIAIIATAAILFFYIRNYKKYGLFIKSTMMLILTGAIGNLIDRFAYTKVVDWIDFFGIWNAIFNIADSCIVVGSIMLIVYLIIEEVKDYRAKKALEPETEGKVISKEEQARIDRDKEEEEVDN